MNIYTHTKSTLLALIGFILLANTVVKAQSDTTEIDSNKKAKVDTVKHRSFSISFGDGKGLRVKWNKKDSVIRKDKKDNTRKDGFIAGITFARFDIGFSRLMDNGSFSLSPANRFLSYNGGKTSHVSFDLLQMGYRFSDQFKLFLSAGFDWTLIRLNDNITMQKNTPTLTYTTENINFSKNRFSSSYLHIPLNFEFRTKANQRNKRFYFTLSPEIGFLMSGKVKQVSKERGKEKIKDNYNFAPFRYGGAFRFGYNNLGLFVKYYANDMFDSAPQAGLKNMAFGVTFGLH